MKAGNKKEVYAIPIQHFVFVFFLSFVIVNSISWNVSLYKLRLEHCILFGGMVFVGVIVVSIAWIAIAQYFKNKGKIAFHAYTSLVLSPIALLLLWPAQETKQLLFIPIIMIILNQVVFFSVLLWGDGILVIDVFRQKKIIIIGMIFYSILFIYLGIQKYHNFTFFNPKDFAIYNQTFWNTIHGRVFQNSTYGSNFTCHNSVFFFLLVPFYFLFPFPQTLLVLQTIFLALSTIPFYMIAKRSLNDYALLLLTLSFMSYPYLISQNLTPPP